MRIADQRGEPVSLVKSAYPESDFRAYVEYAAREPTVGDRLDWWMSQVLAAVLNITRAKGQKAADSRKLIPDRWGDRKRKRRRRSRDRTPQQWSDFLRSICVAYGGKVVDRGSECGQPGDSDQR